MSNFQSEVKEALANYESDVQKFDEKGTKAAGVRARKFLQQIISLSKSERNRINEVAKSRKEQN